MLVRLLSFCFWRESCFMCFCFTKSQIVTGLNWQKQINVSALQSNIISFFCPFVICFIIIFFLIVQLCLVNKKPNHSWMSLKYGFETERVMINTKNVCFSIAEKMFFRKAAFTVTSSILSSLIFFPLAFKKQAWRPFCRKELCTMQCKEHTDIFPCGP